MHIFREGCQIAKVVFGTIHFKNEKFIQVCTDPFKI